MITYAAILFWGLINGCSAQVSYDPSSIVGWTNSPQYDSYILSPYDIILDRLESNTLPPKLRSPYFLEKPNEQTATQIGFHQLRISGSGQYSAGQLAALVQHLVENYQVKRDKIIVVDLREEPHGFINNNSVTFYYGPLSLKRNQSPATALKDDGQRIQFIRAMPYALINYLTKGEDGLPNNKVPKILAVLSAITEQQLAQALGVHYSRIPVTDHFRPNNQEVDNFIDLIESLDSQFWIHVKCRGGRGRTTTFMMLYDMLKNPTLPKDAFFKRQKMIEGSQLGKAIPILHKEWKWALAMDRAVFLDRFYGYLHARDGYGKYKWSQWVEIHYPGSMDETYNSIIE